MTIIVMNVARIFKLNNVISFWNNFISYSDVVQTELGTGTFGKVYQCQDRKYDRKVAVKVVRSIKVKIVE